MIGSTKKRYTCLSLHEEKKSEERKKCYYDRPIMLKRKKAMRKREKESNLHTHLVIWL
jgi:hypothetical protein